MIIHMTDGETTLKVENDVLRITEDGMEPIEVPLGGQPVEMAMAKFSIELLKQFNENYLKSKSAQVDEIVKSTPPEPVVKEEATTTARSQPFGSDGQAPKENPADKAPTQKTLTYASVVFPAAATPELIDVFKAEIIDLLELQCETTAERMKAVFHTTPFVSKETVIFKGEVAHVDANDYKEMLKKSADATDSICTLPDMDARFVYIGDRAQAIEGAKSFVETHSSYAPGPR